MTQTMQEFQQRLRCDRSFRQRIIAARKNGTLSEILALEGYELDFGSLDVQLPRVRTGLRGGVCYCLISKPDTENK